MEPLSTGRLCFKQTIEELLALGLDESVVTQDKCSAKVHALNILRALFKDSKLRDDVAPYVADGLKTAILGFNSPMWAVRNSATLLMTALMTRIFGVKRSKDETTFDRKNCQTGRTFFYHYPCLYQFLLDEIAMATEHVTSQLHPGLYPILMVLGRLFPSSMEGTDTSLNLSAFIPYVVKCSSNPVLKTRVMAAKAIQPLVDKDHMTCVFSDLLTLLPYQPTDVLMQNQIHGVLLQISKLLETIHGLPSSIHTQLTELIYEKWWKIMDCLLSGQNQCVLTRKITLNVTFNLIKKLQLFQLIPKICDILITEINDLDSTFVVWTPCLSQFQSAICCLWCDLFLLSGAEDSSGNSVSDKMNVMNDQVIGAYVKVFRISNVLDNLFETVVIKLLRSESYEVREIILRKLSILYEESESSRSNDKMTLKNDLDFTSNPDEGQGRESPSGVLESKSILTWLLLMVDVEENEDCKIELFRLLGKCCGRYLATDEQKVKLLCAVHQVVEHISDDKFSDALVSAQIAFLGTAIFHFLSSNVSDVALGDTRPPVTLTDVVDRFIQIVQGHTSLVETSCEILQSCAQSIFINCDFFLGNSRKLAAICVGDNIVTCVFRCVLDLLQSDDLEARETASSIVSKIAKDKLNGIVCHSYVAMEVLLDLWVNKQIISDSHGILDTLITILTDNKEDSQDFEERLFDRGEINTYWDELDFLKKLDTALHVCTEDMAVPGDSVDRKQHLPNIQDDEPSSTRVDSVTNATYRTMFLNTNVYQDQVLCLYKQYILYKYRSFICSAGHCVLDVGDIYYNAVRNCNSDGGHSIWPTVVVDCISNTREQQPTSLTE